MSVRLYSYYRSSAAYRVRIALNYKNIQHEIVPVSLLKDVNDSERLEYKKINPQGLLPFLEDDEIRIGQSMAIIEYLEEVYPERSLLPDDKVNRAYVRQIANIISCDIHPLNNLRVLKYLKSDFEVSEQQSTAWYQHWVMEGLSAVEQLLSECQISGLYCYGDQITLADICLIPQLYNAHRFDCSLDDFPIIKRIESECLKLKAFVQASPENQIDAPVS